MFVHRSLSEIETGFESVLKESFVCREKIGQSVLAVAHQFQREKAQKENSFTEVYMCVCVLEAAKCFNKRHACVCLFLARGYGTRYQCRRASEHTCKRPTIRKWNENFFLLHSVFYILL